MTPLEEVLAKFARGIYKAGPQTGVFTDGSAVPNPGPGGWGFVWVKDGVIQHEARGRELETTNNRMELTAIIEALKIIPLEEKVTIYSDSNLCVKSLNEWCTTWELAGWQRKSGAIANLSLVKLAFQEYKKRADVKLEWIKAHNGWVWNEYADTLSTMT
jgi:ribonuclease HI